MNLGISPEGSNRWIRRPHLVDLTKWDSLRCAAVTQSVYKYALWRMRPLNWDTAYLSTHGTPFVQSKYLASVGIGSGSCSYRRCSAL